MNLHEGSGNKRVDLGDEVGCKPKSVVGNLRNQTKKKLPQLTKMKSDNTGAKRKLKSIYTNARNLANKLDELEL